MENVLSSFGGIVCAAMCATATEEVTAVVSAICAGVIMLVTCAVQAYRLWRDRDNDKDKNDNDKNNKGE